MPSVRCSHHLAGAVAFNLARRIAGRARYIVAFVCNILPAQFNRGWRSLNRAVSCRLVAIQDQISFHNFASNVRVVQIPLHEQVSSRLCDCKRIELEHSGQRLHHADRKGQINHRTEQACATRRPSIRTRSPDGTRRQQRLSSCCTLEVGTPAYRRDHGTRRSCSSRSKCQRQGALRWQ
jgi:hypothetical protein